MTSPVTDPGPPPAPPEPAPRGPRPSRADRFFAWTAGLGIVRTDGWLGGVAAGIAARLRIDPLIVRGILVVVALFGFPALLLYAIAWALLPDLAGRILLQEALRGRFSPAQAGVAICAVLGIIPAPISLFLGLPVLYVGSAPFGGYTALGILLALIGVGLAAALVVIIVRAARHTPPASRPAVDADARTASVASVAPVESATASGSGPDAVPADPEGVDAAGFAASTPSSLPSLSSVDSPDCADVIAAPTTTDAPIAADDAAPASTEQPDEYAAWREQHAAWKAQDDAWRRQQQDAARIARDQARLERHARGAAFSAEAAERRRLRKASNPRTPFAFVATVLGIAIVAGALVAVTGATELAGARGLFVAALVTAIGMIAAGIARRRSGFLAFVTVVLLTGGLAATAVPALTALHIGGYGISNGAQQQKWTAEHPFVQPYGDVSVWLINNGHADEPIHIVKRTGTTWVRLERGVTLHLDVTAPAGMLSIMRADGAMLDVDAADLTTTSLADGRVRSVGTYTSAPIDDAAGITTEQTLVIDQQTGWIAVELPVTSGEDTR